VAILAYWIPSSKCSGALRPSCFWLLSLRFQRFQLRFSGQHDGLMSRITNPNLEVPSFWTKFQTRHQLNLEPVSGHAQMMSSTEHSIMINTTSIVCMVCPYRDSQMLLSPQCQFVCLLLKLAGPGQSQVVAPRFPKPKKNTFWVVSNKSIQKIGTSRPICFDQFLKILELFTQAVCKWLSLPFVDCRMSIPDCHRHEATFSTTWETGAW
jgi:hypothetical protein